MKYIFQAFWKLTRDAALALLNMWIDCDTFTAPVVFANRIKRSCAVFSASQSVLLPMKGKCWMKASNIHSRAIEFKFKFIEQNRTIKVKCFFTLIWQNMNVQYFFIKKNPKLSELLTAASGDRDRELICYGIHRKFQGDWKRSLSEVDKMDDGSALNSELSSCCAKTENNALKRPFFPRHQTLEFRRREGRKCGL